MEHERFRDWFSRVDELTAAQRKELVAVLSDPPEGAASLAAIELGVDDERRCPHCGTGGAVSRGARSSPFPVQGLREDVRCTHGHGAVGAAPQGALAVLWRLACRGRDDQGVRRALRDCAEHGASLATPLSGGGAPGAGPACRDRRGGRDLHSGEPERGSGSSTGSRAGAAARPASAASRASRCRSWSPPIVAARPSAIPCPLSRRTA